MEERDHPVMAEGLGRRVFQARLALSAQLGYSVSQTAVGKALGTTGTSIGRYESGLKTPDLEMIERLALVLRVTPCYLAFGCRHVHALERRAITESEAEPIEDLPTHPPKKRALENDETGPPAPPAPIRPRPGAGARLTPAARTSRGRPRTQRRPKG
jgi:transcriptional regulator with XRE-family HTH domain